MRRWCNSWSRLFFEAVEDEETRADTPAAEPGPVRALATTDSPFVFTLKDTLRRLGERSLSPAGPFATQIERGHPALAHHGAPHDEVRPGVPTAPYCTTANNIYAVVRGRAPPISTASGSNGGVAMSSRHRPGVPIGTRHRATLSCFASPTSR